VEPEPQKGYTLVTWEPSPAYGSSRQPLISPRVYALRRRLTLFGHDARNWEDAPENIKLRYSSRRGGLLFSANRGEAWQALSASLPEQPVRALAINQRGDIFAGVASAGIFRSSDSGSSWEQINIGLTNLDVSALAVDEKGYLLAGTSNGVFRSADNGNQWEMIRGEFRLRRLPFRSPVNTELPLTTTRSLVAFTDTEDQRSYVLAGTDRGIFRSVNGSNGWRPVNRGLPKRDRRTGHASVAVFALAADPLPRRMFAGTDYGVFCSTNNGGRWRPANSGLPNTDADTGLTTTAIHALLALAQPVDGQPDSVRPEPVEGPEELPAHGSTGSPLTGIFARFGLSKNPGPQTCLFAGTDQGVFCSNDNGESWRPANQGLPDTNPDSGITSTRISHLAACVDPESQRTYLFAGTDKGVFRSDDNGESWSEITPDLLDKSVYALASGPPGGLVVATPTTGVAWISCQ
jgi:ligand-binding sensor domain-containing protein